MTEPVYCDVEKRHDFVLLFDVTNGNPNGDPDAGNLPRVDPETMHGLVTDVSIKRKIRDWVDLTHGSKERFKIYVQNKGIALNTLHERAYTALNIKVSEGKQKKEEVDRTARWMCENFYDIRTFGAVMNTRVNCGQVRGPIQITFATSIDPIIPLDLAITRVAITQVGTDKVTEMGRKAIVPYALYMGYGFMVPHFARQTGFSSEDLNLFWRALQSAWELDRSASRGFMALRGLYIFSHDNPLGNAPAHRLFERIQPALKEGVTTPRHFHDYDVQVDDTNMPDGVTLTTLEDMTLGEAQPEEGPETAAD
jgi:CRISPR-associated protein Csd2